MPSSEAPAAIWVGLKVMCARPPFGYEPNGRTGLPKLQQAGEKRGKNPGQEMAKPGWRAPARLLQSRCGSTPSHPVRGGRALDIGAVLARARARGLRAGGGPDRRGG